MSDTPEKKDPRKAAYEQNLAAAREHMVEQQLVAFTENVLGRVPTNDEIVAKSLWVYFSKTPLTIFKKGDVEFHGFFVWDRTEVLGVGFYTPGQPLVMHTCRLHRNEWPPALVAYIAQHPNTTTGTA